VPLDGHRGPPGGRRTARVVVEQRGRLRDLDVVVHREVIRAGQPLPVRCLVLVHEHERLRPVAAFVEPLQGQVGDDVGRVAGEVGGAVGRAEPGVVVGALADQHPPVVEAGRLGLEVPLADDRRLVAGLLEQLGERLLRRVELDAVVDHPVRVAVLPRLDHRPARRADRVRHKTVMEDHPLGGQAVDLGRLVDLRAVGADRVRGVVVGEDEEDVGPLRRFGRGGCGEADRDRRNQHGERPENGSCRVHVPAPIGWGLREDLLGRPARSVSSEVHCTRGERAHKCRVPLAQRPGEA